MEKREKLWWRKPQLWKGCTLGILILVLIFVMEEPEIFQASAYEDAYLFYQSYANDMVFQPGADNVGEIYYGTKAKRNANTGIRYTTIGWKVRIFNHAGALVETLYYQLGGNQMTSVDVKTVAGYEYCLYRVTLSNLKSRLSSAGLEALNSPNCNIVFDACITTKLDGKIQGAMTDSGPSWGKVYTTYNGIVHAQDWSTDTKESLKSYYNKMVDGLFYEVNVFGTAGIKQVSGSGKYCFGTTVKVEAEVEDGYHFRGWEGYCNSAEECFSFVLYGNNVDLTATAEENKYQIFFDAAGGQGDIAPKLLRYSENLYLPTEGFFMENAKMAGWKLSAGNGDLRFITGQELSMQEIVNLLQLQKLNGASIYFYAIWDESPYIKTESIYVSLQDAKAGKVTEEWLAKKAVAFDQEDGEIPYGKNEKTSFYMENYKASTYKEFQEEGSMIEKFWAVDSAGNVSQKDIQIHIVDTMGYSTEMVFGRVRFISKSYFKDENGHLIEEEHGGLMNNSIWRWDVSYRAILEKLFESN